jgi:hypothetical protein
MSTSWLTNNYLVNTLSSTFGCMNLCSTQSMEPIDAMIVEIKETVVLPPTVTTVQPTFCAVPYRDEVMSCSIDDELPTKRREEKSQCVDLDEDTSNDAKMTKQELDDDLDRIVYEITQERLGKYFQEQEEKKKKQRQQRFQPNETHQILWNKTSPQNLINNYHQYTKDEKHFPIM